MPVFISLVCVCKQRSHFVLGVLQVITKGKRIAGEEEAVNCLQQGRNLLGRVGLWLRWSSRVPAQGHWAGGAESSPGP